MGKQSQGINPATVDPCLSSGAHAVRWGVKDSWSSAASEGAPQARSASPPLRAFTRNEQRDTSRSHTLHHTWSSRSSRLPARRWSRRGRRRRRFRCHRGRRRRRASPSAEPHDCANRSTCTAGASRTSVFFTSSRQGLLSPLYTVSFYLSRFVHLSVAERRPH